VLAPAVLHHLPTPMQPTEADDRILQWLVARLAESEFYLVRCAQTSTLLGLMVLAEQTEQYGPDIVRVGYMLAQDAWGRGYATELVNGLVSALRGGGQPVRLLAGVGKDNTPSMRVLVKAGFAIDSDLSDNRTRVFSLAVAQCKDLRD
jgi:RimJ/RimL family protein N-acetyltransferase